MNPVVVNADDLGLSREINEGIIKGLQAGVVSDTSLLIDGPCAGDAMEKLEKIGLAHLGLHINLDVLIGWDKPGEERFSRERLEGLFQDKGFLGNCRDHACLQIEHFLGSGLVPTHVDTHHHVHGFFPLFTLLIELMKTYHIPAVRFSRGGYSLTTRKPVPYDPVIYQEMESILLEEGIYFCRAMSEGAEKMSGIEIFPAELVVHPSIGGDPWRIRETEVLFSEQCRLICEEKSIRLVGYRELINDPDLS